MKYLSLKILFICVVLPPVMYIFTIQGMEALFHYNWKSELKSSLISHPEELLEGRKKVQEEIKDNVKEFLGDTWAVDLGIDPKVLVRTESGKQIYPRYSYYDDFSLSRSDSFAQNEDITQMSEIAKQNMEIMQDGLVLNLDVHIPRNSWLAGLVLSVYILAFSSLLIVSYRRNARYAENLLIQKHQELEGYQQQLESASAKLQTTYDRERKYQEQIEQLRNELSRTDNKLQSTEENALAEIESLERKLAENVEAKKNKEVEVENLKQEIAKFEKNRNKPESKKTKQEKEIFKRFNTLYKNLQFEQRAVEGFLALSSEQQLKAEKLIHSLDIDPGQVKVKRKVFLKKGESKVLETEFAYYGRIYWRQNSAGQIHIVTIGTKDTQKRDLGYVENLSV